MTCEDCDAQIVGEGVIFYEDVPGDVIQHHFCSETCQDAYYETGGFAAKAAHRATLAERERILALIRAKAEEWEAENQRVIDYGGTPVLEGEVLAAREFADLIEKGTPSV